MSGLSPETERNSNSTLRPNVAKAQASKAGNFQLSAARIAAKTGLAKSMDRFDIFRRFIPAPGGQRRTSHIRISPATADPIPTTRRMLSGVASALFMARRIQDGLAANNNP